MTRARPAKAMHSKCQVIKLFFTVRTHLNRQAGNWVSSIYLMAYRVERKPVLSTAEWCLLDCILILLGRNFFEYGLLLSFVLLQNSLLIGTSCSLMFHSVTDETEFWTMKTGQICQMDLMFIGPCIIALVDE